MLEQKRRWESSKTHLPDEPPPLASLSHLHALDCMFSKYSSKLLMIKCRSNCYSKKTMYWMRRIRGYLGNIRKKEAIMVLVGNTLALLLRRWETEKNNLHNFFLLFKKEKAYVVFWITTGTVSGLCFNVLYDFLAVKQAKIKPQDKQPSWEEAWF